MPGMTMSMKIRSGLISRARRTPSAPSAAAAVRKPCFSSAFCMTCNSVGESSTIRIKGMTTSSRGRPAQGVSRPLSGSGPLRSSPDMRLDRGEQLVLGEGLGEVMLGTYDATAGAIEQTVLGRQHDHGYGAEHLVVFDERAGLVTVQPRHHDVDEYDVRLMVGDLGERIEAIDRREDLAALLRQQRLGRAANGLAVVDDEDLQAL